MSQADKKRDRKLLAWLLGSVFMLIVGIGVLTPKRNDQDPRPTTENAGSAGAKAALLTLQAMGRSAVAWDEPADRIAGLDAAHTTLVLAEPEVALGDRLALAKALRRFLERGGHVLLTGAGERAQLLPGGKTEAAAELAPKFCETTPEGRGRWLRRAVCRWRSREAGWGADRSFAWSNGVVEMRLRYGFRWLRARRFGGVRRPR